MYIDKIQLKGRTLDEAILRYKDELERIIIESTQDNQIINKQFSQSNNSQNTPLFKVLLWIKKSLGKQINLNDLSFPSSYRINDFVGSFNGYGINIRTRLYYHRIIDFSKNPIFKVNISWFSNHLEYSMQIVDNEGMVSVNCQVPSYEALLALSSFIGYDSRSFIDSLTKQIKKLLEEAGNDKNMLDVIYEKGPTNIIKKLKTFEGLSSDVELLADTNLLDYFDGTGDEKALITAIKTLFEKNASKLYEYYLSDSNKLLSHYNALSGGYRKEFMSIILKICERKKGFNTDDYVVLPDGYWFQNIVLTLKVTNSGCLEITNSQQESSNLERRIVNLVPSSQSELEHRGFIKTNPYSGTDADIRKYVESHLISKPFEVDPLCFVKTRTVIETVNENEVKYAETVFPAIFLKYKVDEINDKVFWDVVNVATSIAGGYGAIRVLTIKGAGVIAKSIAIAELSKESMELAMLSNKFRNTLSKNGLQWLVDKWTLISITTDISTLGIQGLLSLIRKGNKGAKILKEAGYSKEADFLKNKVKEARNALDEIANKYKKLQTSLAKELSKDLDTFGAFEEVKKVEDYIRGKIDREYGAFFDYEDGFKLTEKYIEGTLNGASISIEGIVQRMKLKNVREGGKANNLVFIHNHIDGSALSPSDILAAIRYNLSELRAIGRNGIDYSLKRTKSSFPLEGTTKYNDIMEKIEGVMKSKYPKLSPNKYTTGGGSVKIAEFYAETLLEQFKDYIEYTKFTN